MQYKSTSKREFERRKEKTFAVMKRQKRIRSKCKVYEPYYIIQSYKKQIR